METLVIPLHHYAKFKRFISLSMDEKANLLTQIASAPAGLSYEAFSKYVLAGGTGGTEELVRDVLEVYFNLLKAKENSGHSLPHFLKLLSNALLNTKDMELQPSSEVIQDFERLLSSNEKFVVTTKLMEVMSENAKTFLDAKVFQDVRPVFDSSDNLIASGLVHTLKINFSEGNNDNEILVSLDDTDIDKLLILLKKAQIRSVSIRKQLGEAKIIELK